MPPVIQFEKAEFASGEHCVECQNPLQTSYFQLNGNTLCPGCAEKARFDQQLHQSQGAGFGRAVLFGLGAAVAGAVIYGTIAVVTGYEFGLIAILIGWMVGKAMMRGSRGIGGRRLQVVAILITYMSITAGYVPGIVKELINIEAPKPESPAETAETESKDAPAEQATPAATSFDATNDAPAGAAGIVFALVFVLGIAAIAPLISLTSGISGIISLVIIGFGLMQAWKETRENVFALSGPFPFESRRPEINEVPS